MIVPYEKPKSTPKICKPGTVTGSYAKQVKNNEKQIIDSGELNIGAFEENVIQIIINLRHRIKSLPKAEYVLFCLSQY